MALPLLGAVSQSAGREANTICMYRRWLTTALWKLGPVPVRSLTPVPSRALSPQMHALSRSRSTDLLSRCVTVSDVPEGPYTFQSTAFNTFHHNPQLRLMADGTVLMFMIGGESPPPKDCKAGRNPKHLEGRIIVSSAAAIEGAQCVAMQYAAAATH